MRKVAFQYSNLKIYILLFYSRRSSRGATKVQDTIDEILPIAKRTTKEVLEEEPIESIDSSMIPTSITSAVIKKESHISNNETAPKGFVDDEILSETAKDPPQTTSANDAVKEILSSPSTRTQNDILPEGIRDETANVDVTNETSENTFENTANSDTSQPKKGKRRRRSGNVGIFGMTLQSHPSNVNEQIDSNVVSQENVDDVVDNNSVKTQKEIEFVEPPDDISEDMPLSFRKKRRKKIAKIEVITDEPEPMNVTESGNVSNNIVEDNDVALNAVPNQNIFVQRKRGRASIPSLCSACNQVFGSKHELKIHLKLCGKTEEEIKSAKVESIDKPQSLFCR